MRLLPQSIKPSGGLAHFLHRLLLLVLPVVVFILIRLEFEQIAIAVVCLSKWRTLAVRPRFWAANLRSNAVDIMFGISMVLFMAHSGSLWVQIVWAVVYAVWLIAIKPASGTVLVALQAFIGQLAALTALFMAWSAGPTYALTLTTGLICFLSARHFLDAFDEPYARMLALFWGYFGAALAWLSSHWLLYYGGVAQPTLLLNTLGYGLAIIYYLDHNDRLSKGARRQLAFIMLAIVVVVLAFSDWGGKVV